VKSSARDLFSRLAQSRRVLVGLVLLGTLTLIGVFAEIIASPAPIVAFGHGGVALFPGVVRPASYEALTRAEIDQRHDGDVLLWPLVRYGPIAPTEAGPNAAISSAHPLGTDAVGRDLLARLVYGARTALGLSLPAVLLGMILGVGLGGLAGILRGFWNERLVRLVETVDTFPAIIVVALVRAIERKPSALSLVIAVALVRWAEVARLVRAEVLHASTNEYVLAARALGASPLRIFFRHVLPSAVAPAIMSSATGVASVVLLEAAMSFLHMGAPSREASWGETLAEGAGDPARLRLILLPGLLLLITVGSSYMLADAVRDAIDPRSPNARPRPEDTP
jgi:ABC-type dipeptide/oligopeptide/nickel transport system permease subunit